MNLARLISTVHNQKNSYMNGYLKALGLSHGQAITLKIIHEQKQLEKLLLKMKKNLEGKDE